jgi:hypothetical protein
VSLEDNDELGDDQSMKERAEPEMPLLFAALPRRWAVAGGLGKTSTGEGDRVRRSELEQGNAATAGLELFQSANGTAKNGEGYERWKAEAASARAEETAARRAEELPVTNDGAGYAVWKAEIVVAKRALEQRWGVPLGKPVRVRLRGEALEREGRLTVVEDGKPGGTLWLRLGAEEFEAGRIESVVRWEGEQ